LLTKAHTQKSIIDDLHCKGVGFK